MGTSRSDFRWLAGTRIREARALLEQGLFDGAYYLAGYAVECALKARIVQKFRRSELPDRTLVNDMYKHDLEKLLGLADLKGEFERARSDTEFALNWSAVKNWRSEARYEAFGRGVKPGRKGPGAEQRARELYKAITDRRHGVLPWLKRFW